MIHKVSLHFCRWMRTLANRSIIVILNIQAVRFHVFPPLSKTLQATSQWEWEVRSEKSPTQLGFTLQRCFLKLFFFFFSKQVITKNKEQNRDKYKYALRNMTHILKHNTCNTHPYTEHTHPTLSHFLPYTITRTGKY